MKNYLAILLLFICSISYGQDTVLIKHNAYISVFCKSAHIPVLVSYTLKKEQVDCYYNRVSRTNNFHPDASIPLYTSLDRDYKKSGYDKGHNMSAEDNICNEMDMNDCFSYCNMFPQTPILNRGIWKSLETRERKLAVDNDSIIVYIGSFGLEEKIGTDSVYVPSYCWKSIYIPKTNNSYLYFFQNNNKITIKNLDSYIYNGLPLGLDKWSDYIINKYKNYGSSKIGSTDEAR